MALDSGGARLSFFRLLVVAPKLLLIWLRAGAIAAAANPKKQAGQLKHLKRNKNLFLAVDQSQV